MQTDASNPSVPDERQVGLEWSHRAGLVSVGTKREENRANDDDDDDDDEDDDE